MTAPKKRIRDILPIPGIPEEEAKKLSRQQRYKLRRYTQGVCVSCGKEPRCDLSRTLCTSCLAIQRERMRQRIGASRRHFRSKSYYAIPVVESESPVGPAAESIPAPEEKRPTKKKRASAPRKGSPEGTDGPHH
jgi:hypothetical protein